MRFASLAFLLGACAGTEAFDAPAGQPDAPMIPIYDARVDAVRVDARGLVVRDARLRDATPAADADLLDAPTAPVDAAIDVPVVADAGIIDAPAHDAPVADAMVPCDIELLGNRDFDSTTGSGTNKNIAPWVQNPADVVATAAELAANGQPAPDTGNYAAWLGGDSLRTDYIYQSVAVPVATRSLRVRGSLYIHTNEPSPNMFDRMFINIYSTSLELLETVAIYYDGDETFGWDPFDRAVLDNYAGQTILLAFESENGLLYDTSFLVDTLSLNARVCP